MSSRSEKVRVALYTKLNVSGVTSLATGGVFESKAPQTATFPYVIFFRSAPGAVEYSFGTASAPTNQLESDLWAVQAYVDDAAADAANKSAQALAEEIAQACETAIGNSLTLSGNTAVWVARFADLPPIEEQQSDRHIYRRGFQLRVDVA